MNALIWAVSAFVAAAEPSDQTLVYYNARLALREEQPTEAVKLWLLRNAIEDQTGVVSAYDPDFHSVTWAALGALGICQDGHPKDEGGAGLWPVALHNWVVANMRRRPSHKGTRPFDAFNLGRQQRFISIRDVLDATELPTVRLSRGQCLGPMVHLYNAGEALGAELSDRQVAARMLRYFLTKAQETLDGDIVQGKAALEARRFDLNLQLTQLAAQQARRELRASTRAGRQGGLSTGAIASIENTAPTYAFEPDSEPARILRGSLAWPVSEWQTLSPERQLFIYDHARGMGGDPAALDRIALGLLDALVAEGQGVQAETWIGHWSAGDPSGIQAVWGGERGQALLNLDDEQGFRERSVIALHRGVAGLQAGDLNGALRLFSLAMHHAPDSRAADEVQGLSRRWLSFVAGQFEITDGLLITLAELVPRRDYNIILEDMLWHAALNADRSSFDRGAGHQRGRGALMHRIDLLQPLARGDIGGFSREMRRAVAKSPSVTLRFLKQLVTRLEMEDADVRRAHVPTLLNLRTILQPLTPDAGNKGSQARTALALVDRCQGIIEGVGQLDGLGMREQAHALGPLSEVYAGSLRLAPSDPLPWPFPAPTVQAPSVFDPLALIPLEWRDSDGDLVFGWRISG